MPSLIYKDQGIDADATPICKTVYSTRSPQKKNFSSPTFNQLGSKKSSLREPASEEQPHKKIMISPVHDHALHLQLLQLSFKKVMDGHNTATSEVQKNLEGKKILRKLKRENIKGHHHNVNS